MTHLDDSCDDGEHIIIFSGNGVPICSRCGLSAQTITDYLGHDWDYDGFKD